MTKTSVRADLPSTLSAAPKRPPIWTEEVWRERLEAAVGDDRRNISPIAGALPLMLVALDWHRTARSLAALLPPSDVPLTLDHLQQILQTIGFRSERSIATGGPSDTSQLRAGSLVQTLAGEVGVYLGQPNGLDRWLVKGTYRDFTLSKGDTIFAVEPDLAFRPVNEGRPNWFRDLFEQIRGELFKLFALSFVINVLALAVALYIMMVYSVAIPSGSISGAWGVTLLTIVAVIGGWALTIGRQFVTAWIGSWAGTRIAAASMQKMLALPVDTTTKLGAQNNIVRMRGFESARSFLSGAGGVNLIDFPFVVIFIMVIALLGGWLVFVPIIALLTFAAVAIPTSDYMSSKSTAAGVASGRLEENAVSAFYGMNAFHQVGADSQWLSRFAMLARQSAVRNREYATAAARAQAIGQSLSSLTVLATLCVGIVLVLTGTMNPGGLIATMMLIWRITTPAQQAFGSMVRLRQVKSSVDQLDRLMATPAESLGSELSSPAGLANIVLTAERLYYKPDADNEAALNGVSFSVPAGERVAIAGPSAGGKTVLLECLAGLRRPQSGRILIGGRDIRQFDTTEYRAWVGYVPQFVPALPLTVRDYLRLRTPTLSDDEAFAGFERVFGTNWWQLSVFGRSADKVLDREINPFSEDIAELQFRHLIAFIAATLNHPALLLLDGDGIANSPEWEDRILRYLDSIRGTTTVVWAPHSTAHILACQQIVILERGSVVRAGPTAKQPALAS